ncbi:MAG TPA: aldo/keto reductase [Alphaproteobacteria bacterium]|nr:aldo/keto reductase [Alphaproteobacteria bacterium]
MDADRTLTLNDGRAMPRLGLGTWQAPDAEAADVVRRAIGAGYRSIDTAAIYGNEAGVGRGIRESGVPREELFVTTKLWNDRHGFDSALRAFDESLGRLGLDFVDLYLIHWPVPGRDRYVDAWRALVRLQQEGRARSIGVSNFQAEHLRRVADETGVTPAVNQVELHPAFQQAALRRLHEELGIATTSWSPLGQGRLLAHETIAALARKHGRTPAQVIIRWHLEMGLIVIPKSVTPTRIEENAAVFDFRLDPQDMAAIAALDDPQGRIGPDPMTFA